MPAATKRLLWVDDEIDLLRPHLLLMQGRGYHVDAASNGDDAIELVRGRGRDLSLRGATGRGRGGAGGAPVPAPPEAPRAIDRVRGRGYDLILLDEQMPGRTGMEVLDEIRRIDARGPGVMGTKSEEARTRTAATGGG